MNIRGSIIHGIADEIMLSPKRGLKVMRLRPRPARCTYLSRIAGGGEPGGCGAAIRRSLWHYSRSLVNEPVVDSNPSLERETHISS